MQYADSLNSIIKWQSSLFSNELDSTLAFSLKHMLLFPNQAAYIVDCRSGEIVESKQLGSIFGYTRYAFQDIEQLYEPIVPNDLPLTLRYTWATLNWIFKNKEVPPLQNFGEFKYRVKLPNDKYHKIMRQTTACGKTDGMITHTLGVLTDITHLDNTRVVHAKVSGPYAEFFDPEIPEVLNTYGVLTARECEILRHVARGFSSKEIGNLLNISSHTIDTHRRNMIHKLEVRNSKELIHVGRDLGLL